MALGRTLERNSHSRRHDSPAPHARRAGRLRRALVPAALLLLAAGCSPLYVLRAGFEEAKILSRREPIPRLVNNPNVPPATREKLRLVLQAREFAEQGLDLDAGDSYTTFSQLDSDTLALVVSAAHKDRFEPYTWWFPIVGRVPYKGFFSEKRARDAIRELEEEGYDTHLRPTSAFSTLGWFADPLVSSLLRYDSVSLANTVIHEILHNTIYLAGEAQFNESFANFVGGRGAIEFFCGQYGAESELCERARADWHDDLLFGEFLSRLVADLEALYARRDLPLEEKLTVREEIFAAARREFVEEVQPRLLSSSYAGFLRGPLNNATLIGRRLYYGRLELFEQAFQRYDGDLDQTIAAIAAAARGADDPYLAVEQLSTARYFQGSASQTGHMPSLGYTQ